VGLNKTENVTTSTTTTSHHHHHQIYLKFPSIHCHIYRAMLKPNFDTLYAIQHLLKLNEY